MVKWVKRKKHLLCTLGKKGTVKFNFVMKDTHTVASLFWGWKPPLAQSVSCNISLDPMRIHLSAVAHENGVMYGTHFLDYQGYLILVKLNLGFH